MVKARASAGRAFRVPTFTERYYVDPVHRASAALRPERGWSVDAGVDWFPRGAWTVSATGFVRRERDVIDWIRPTAADRWETANIRRVETRGVEASLRGRVAGIAVGAQYAWTTVETDSLAGLSKYVLDYAPHGVSGDLVVPLGRQGNLGLRVEGRRPVSRPSYTVVDARAQRRWGRFTVFGEAGNLFDTGYLEVAGVDMPGRWVRSGVEIR